MGVTSQPIAAVTDPSVGARKAEREDGGQDKRQECLAIAVELCVGDFIVAIAGDGAVVAGCLGGLSQVSSPERRWGVRVEHGEHNALKDHADCERIGALPRNAGESGIPAIRSSLAC